MRAGRTKTVTLATSSTPGGRATRRREQRLATTYDEVGAMTAERTARRRRSTWEPVFSREIRTASFPQRFRQPTSIDAYTGETDPRVWLDDYRLAC
jgi:YD repeat-containing protein